MEKVFWRNIPSNTHLCYALPAARKALVEVLHYLKGLSVLNCCDYFIGIGCRTNANFTKQLEQAREHLLLFYPTIQKQLLLHTHLEKTA